MTNAKQRVLDTALELAAAHRYDTITRGQLASAAGVATGSVNYYFTDMAGLRDAVMAEAVEQGVVSVIAQGIVDNHPICKGMTAHVTSNGTRIDSSIEDVPDGDHPHEYLGTGEMADLGIKEVRNRAKELGYRLVPSRADNGEVNAAPEVRAALNNEPPER